MTVAVRAGGKRLLGLGAARALALFGMSLVNVGPSNPESVLQRLYLFPYGRAPIPFVVIAGVGMGYLMNSRIGRARWATVCWRAGLLFVGGLILQSTAGSVRVILPLYGILFLVAPLLWRLRTRALIVLGALMTFLGPAVIVMHAGVQALPHYEEPPSLGASAGEIAHSLMLSGPYPLATWIVPFVAGLAVARCDLRIPLALSRLVRWSGACAVLGLGAGAGMSRLLGDRADIGAWRLLTGVAHGQMPLWLISSVGGAIFVLALCRIVEPRLTATLTWLARCGQLALTFYVGHVVLLAIFTPPTGFTFPQGALVTAASIAAALVLAHWWGATNRLGPMEWLLRTDPWSQRSSSRRTSAGYGRSPGSGTDPHWVRRINETGRPAPSAPPHRQERRAHGGAGA